MKTINPRVLLFYVSPVYPVPALELQSSRESPPSHFLDLDLASTRLPPAASSAVTALDVCCAARALSIFSLAKAMQEAGDTVLLVAVEIVVVAVVVEEAALVRRNSFRQRERRQPANQTMKIA